MRSAIVLAIWRCAPSLRPAHPGSGRADGDAGNLRYHLRAKALSDIADTLIANG
jgi:hypothetical protein